MNEAPSTPDRRTVLAGKAISAVVAHAPWSWPALSRPVMGFFDRAAPGWDERTGENRFEYLPRVNESAAKGVVGT